MNLMGFFVCVFKNKKIERYMKVTERLGIRPNTLFADDNRKGARLTPKRNLVHPKSGQPSTRNETENE